MAGSETWLALCTLAFGLGVRHGFDPDHLAIIDGFARRNAVSRPVSAALSGVLFSLGHGAVMIGAAFAALVLASRWSLPNWIGLAAPLVSAGLLSSLAFMNLRSVWRAPDGAVVRPVGLRAHLLSGASGSVSPLTVAAVGMLFAISLDSLAQAAAISLAAQAFGGPVRVLIAVGAFVVGMLTADGLNGLLVTRLIRLADRRAAAASRILTATIGIVSLVLALYAVANLSAPWISSFGLSGLWFGASVVAVAVAASLALGRLGRGARSTQRSTSSGPLSGLTLHRRTSS